MTSPDDAIPVIPSTDSREPELERVVRRGSVLGSVADFVGRGWIAIRKSVVAAAPVLLVLAAAIGGWWVYAGWRMGRIELTTEGEPVVVQVLGETSDTAIGEPIDLASRAFLELPAGEYRLRVNGKGRLGRTYRFGVNRGETQAHAIAIDEGRLLGHEPAVTGPVRIKRRAVPIPYAPVTRAFELTPGKADLVEWSAGSLICRDGASGTVRWDAFHPRRSFDRKRDPAPWIRDRLVDRRSGSLLELALDLDGVGRRDIVAERVQAGADFEA
jgi:hypothetical protein